MNNCTNSVSFASTRRQQLLWSTASCILPGINFHHSFLRALCYYSLFEALPKASKLTNSSSDLCSFQLLSLYLFLLFVDYFIIQSFLVFVFFFVNKLKHFMANLLSLTLKNCPRQLISFTSHY